MTDSIVSVSRGADLVRRDRQTLYNHRKQGKLSFVKRDDGSFGVDVSELQRVYGKLYITAAEMEESLKVGNQASDLAVVTELKHQLELKDMELKHAQEKVDALKLQADKAANSIKLLEDKSAEKAKLDAAAEAEWKQAIASRKAEVDLARQEADEMRRMGQERIDQLKAENDQLKTQNIEQIAALKSRSWWKRLLNAEVT